MPHPASDCFISPSALLEQWQGHRRLTRRVIELFPDEQFNTFAVGGMRPFGTMAVELLRMAAPTVQGLVDGNWNTGVAGAPRSKAEVLALWDADTAKMNELWPRIPATRFQEKLTAFGQYEDLAYRLVLYVIDNEVHHRGQGYVYLRALNIEPPHFWER
ncbi:MAG: damage-inducible protein DinB [Gemmatimonadota bacterium]|nr:damage-inducible protein DinB [Gemmatimonadota bacterium]